MKILKNRSLTVIIPENYAKSERFAAEELVKYILQITGLKAEICTDAETVNGGRIVIGSPIRNRLSAELISADEFSALVTDAEGIYIKAFGEDTILIAGGGGELERGTVYAVYEFLERFCGCVFAGFTNPEIEGGEYVPTAAELDLNGISYVKKSADTAYRTAIIQYGDVAGSADRGLNIPFLDWLVKNRYNRILTWMSVYEEMKETGVADEIIKRGLRITTGHHDSAGHFMPAFGNKYFPEKYYETHPEYYKLDEDGNRFLIDGKHYGQCIFCSRNDAIYDVLANNIISWVKENPAVDTIAFWPQDGTYPDCLCEKCSKYTKVENYTYFMNEIAKRMEVSCPEVKIDMLLYTDLWECPEGLELSPNLMVDESMWHSTGLRTVGKPDGSCITGTHFEDNILKWKKSGTLAVYYDYYMGVYPMRNRYIPMADEVQSLVKRFAEVGISGSGTQIECFNMWNNLFNFYVFARTAYDSELSMEDNLAGFGKIFGKGAEAVKEIIRIAETCLDGQKDIKLAGIYLMENVDKERIYRLFEEALDAEEKPFFRNNIRLMRMAFRYSDLETHQKGADVPYPYEPVKYYEDIDAELLYMTRFDSFHYNDPGFGIMIPVKGEAGEFVPDKWYIFE